MFAAVDKAIGKQSLKVVTLLRLSRLLPLALSNYLYGLTSVDLGSYVLGSWLGMLPGTVAYVTVSLKLSTQAQLLSSGMLCGLLWACARRCCVRSCCAAASSTQQAAQTLRGYSVLCASQS